MAPPPVVADRRTDAIFGVDAGRDPTARRGKLLIGEYIMSRTETFFYRFIDRRPWRRLIIAAGLIGYFVISLTFLTIGLALIPLRWIRSTLTAPTQPHDPLRQHDATAIN